MTLSSLIFGYMRQYWPAYASSALMLAAIAVLGVLVPRKVGAMVDGLANRTLSGTPLLLELATLTAIGLAIYLLRVGWRLQLFGAAYHMAAGLRTRLYERLSRQGAEFYSRQRTGDMMALATNDIDAIEAAAGEGLLAGFDGSLTMLLVVSMMVLGIDWRLGLAALLPFPFMALAFNRISNRIAHASAESLDSFGNLNDHVQETLAGVRMVRALGLEQRSAAHFAELAGRAAAANLDAQRWEAAYEPAIGVALTTASTLALGVGGYLVWQGELSIGGLTGFSMYLGQLIWPMFAAGWVMAKIGGGRAAVARVAPLLEAPLSVPDGGTLETAPHGTLALDAVRFAYTGQTVAALDGVSLRLAPGQTLGVVGPTGAGKTTLLRLLMRHHAPQSGALTWGGHALADYTLATLRSAISWVPQESFLFSASIADNIALARPDASRAEIEQVARLAAVDEDIARFADGYDTLVGERGVTLSGGQRQRVAIARALLAGSRLLLLDDALSAVDTGTETRILQHLLELRAAEPERCVVLASHRLSAVAEADWIVVLHGGKVTEAGQHQTLLQRNGWYASQWRYQQLEASLEAD